MAVVTPSAGAGFGVTTMLEVGAHAYPGGGGSVGAVTEIPLPPPLFTAEPEFSPQPVLASKKAIEVHAERRGGIFVPFEEAHFLFEKSGFRLIGHLHCGLILNVV